MGLTEFLGRVSDRLTLCLLNGQGVDEIADQISDRMGYIRKAQISAIMAISRPMMLANICNALALVILEFLLDRLTVATMIWAPVVMVLAFIGLSDAKRFRSARPRQTASVRAPGKIAVSSLVLALVWSYPAAVILPLGNMVEVSFISAVTAGMISGGAIALYPVPLASFLYTSIITLIAFVALVAGGILPPIPFALVITSYGLVIVYSAKRHTGMFLSELVGKLRAERQRDIVNLLLDTYQDHEGQYLWRCDTDLNLTTKPGPFMKILGIEQDQTCGRSLISMLDLAEALPTDKKSSEVHDSLRALSPCQDGSFEILMRNHKGQFLKLVGRAEHDEGRVSGYYGYIKDVTTDALAREKVHILATRDTMTGLLNYREFCKRAKNLLEASAEKPGKTLFVFIDADNLKNINDSFGHAVGDLLIETMAARLQGLLPPESVVARKGGDEFVALMHMDEPIDELNWASDIMGGLNHGFQCGEATIPISCCIGISTAEGPEPVLQDLELKADRALYLAKSHGRRKVRVYNDAIGAEIRKGRILANDIESALQEGLLQVKFQPIVDLNNRSVIGAEALVRWRHPVFRTIPPKKIVEIAQTEGQGPALLEYVLRISTEQARHWPNGGFVSVNMNSADLQLTNLEEKVADILQQTGLSADRLWLEVVESEVLRNSRTVQSNLKALREAGVRIAIDDFGTGYSSLSYLGMYQSDIVKIDRSLVGNCDVIDTNKIIIKATRALAKVNGFSVVAEGVETEAEITALQKADFKMAQGYAFHRPMSGERIQHLLEKQEKEATAGRKSRSAVA